MRTIYFVAAIAAAAPAAGQERVPAPADPGSVLSSLVAELESRNPELNAARREVDVRIARVRPAGAPPDPVLSVGYMSGFVRPPFFPSNDTPEAFRQVAVTQELPYPGTLGLRARVAEADVETARAAIEQTRARLVADLKLAYADYVLLGRTIEIVDRSRQALEQFRGVAEARFSVAKASQQDVLRSKPSRPTSPPAMCGRGPPSSIRPSAGAPPSSRGASRRSRSSGASSAPISESG
jgi:outer membrane protein TolC